MTNAVKQTPTQRQSEILAFMKAYIDEHGHVPARSEIASKFETTEKNVARYIDVLCEKGWIRKDSSRRPPLIEIL